jgi:hypothetical protein
VCKGFPFVCRREDEEELALYEECEVDKPYTDCENCDNLIPVPDSDADRFYENPLRKAG